MQYHSRSLRRRRNTDQWEAALSHKDPFTGETLTSYHTVSGKTRKQARTLKRHIGGVRLADVNISTVTDWMASMTESGYAPRSVQKPFVLLKQVMKFAMAQDLITKNPCDYCKPPKLQRKAVNALTREERTRMMRLVRAAEPSPLALAIEIALTTGMRRGEVCGLRWSDLGEDSTLTVNRAISLEGGSAYVKEPKTAGSRRTIPLTPRLFAYLNVMKTDFTRTMERFGRRNADAYILGRQEPDAKRAAVEKIQDAFDIEDSPVFGREAQGEPEFPFTVEQLESLLAYAKGLGASRA